MSASFHYSFRDSLVDSQTLAQVQTQPVTQTPTESDFLQLTACRSGDCVSRPALLIFALFLIAMWTKEVFIGDKDSVFGVLLRMVTFAWIFDWFMSGRKK